MSTALLGWRLTVFALLVILAGFALLYGVSSWTSTSVAAGIDATGRSSLVLFSMTIVASSVHNLWPSSLSQWMLQNRRWIGLSFASSHGIHLALILAMSLDCPDPFLSEQPLGKWLVGGVAYLLIALGLRQILLRSQQPVHSGRGLVQAF